MLGLHHQCLIKDLGAQGARSDGVYGSQQILVQRKVYLKISSVFGCYFVSCLGLLEACALTALFKADVLVNFVDLLIHVVADISFPDRK